MPAINLRRYPVIVLLLTVLVATAACGDGSVELKPNGDDRSASDTGASNDGDAGADATSDPLADESAVLVPWSHEIDPAALQAGTVEDGSIRVSAAAVEAADMEVDDILYSTGGDSPFLRRVRRVERAPGEGELVIETEPAALNELVFKYQKEAPPDGTRRQPALEKKSFVVPSEDKRSLGRKTIVEKDGLAITAEPYVKLNGSVQFDYAIDVPISSEYPEKRDQYAYWGNETCSRDSDCVGAETCGPVPGADDYCRARRSDVDDWSCSEIVEALRFIESNESCLQKWRRWKDYDSGPNTPPTCDGLGWIDDSLPYPTMVEWAKKSENCNGSVQKFELKAGAEADLELRDVEVSVSKDADFKEYSQRLAQWTPVVHIQAGPVPVPITFDIRLNGSVTPSLEGSATWGLKEPIGFQKPFSIDTNARFYANRQQAGSLYEGKPLGRLHTDFSQAGPSLYPVTLDRAVPDVNIEGSVEVALGPTIDMKIFDAVGPVLTTEAYSVFEGQTDAGKDQCTMGMKVGARATAGGTVQVPICGEDCFQKDFTFDPYRTCGDVCATGNSLCYEHCFTGDCGQTSQSCNQKQCPKDGATECAGPSGWEVCRDHDGDGCREWGGGQSCGSGQACNNGACMATSCQQGESRCENGQMQSCKADGSGWKSGKSCDCGCAGDQCAQSTCSPGERKCRNGNVVECGAKGCGFTQVDDCQHGCDGGICKSPNCTPGTKKCSGQTLLVCKSDGSGFRTDQTCTCGCDGQTKSCVGTTCKPAKKRCAGDTLERCDSNGCNWVTDKTCSHGCSGGSCKPPPSQCTGGPCCDSQGNYKSAGTVCASQADEKYKCRNGEWCGEDVSVRYRDKICSGTSSSCTDWGSWSDWTIADTCSSNERCEVGKSTCQSGSTDDFDLVDNDCDGKVDESDRKQIFRRVGSKGNDPNHPDADWDHCFSESKSGQNCHHYSSSLLGNYAADGKSFWIYKLSVGSGDEVSVPGTGYKLARLAECYLPRATEHRYFTTDSPQYSYLKSNGWKCGNIGYVKTGTKAGFYPNHEITIREHRHKNATDFMYSTIRNEASSLGYTDKGEHFFAWDRP